MTAKEDGLWMLIPQLPGTVGVSAEDIRHMQSRVCQFHAREQVPAIHGREFAEIPYCAESFCKWLLVDAADAATGTPELPLRRLQARALPTLPTESSGTMLDENQKDAESQDSRHIFFTLPVH